MHKTLLCTGFHRSATSATAEYLLNAGLNMGCDLMRGSVSNPHGHYEDWPVVRLHDEQLRNNDTDWQFHSDAPLSIEPGFLASYIRARNKLNSEWGVKDPRACLFLNEWNQALGDSGYYLLIARHWSSCIESLLNRHSRDFAFNLPKLCSDTVSSPTNVGMNFWSDPQLAANMWLAYNKRLVAFVKQHPERTLVLTQRALFSGAPFIEKLNKDFGFHLDSSVDPSFDESLLNDRACESIPQSLSLSMRKQLDDVWNELLSLATFRNEDESPSYYTQAALDEDFFALYQSHLEQSHSDTFSATSSNHNDLASLDYLNEEACIKWLQKVDASNVNTKQSEEIFDLLTTHFLTSAKVWIEYGRLCTRAKHFEMAIKAFHLSLELGKYFPFISMHLGQCYQGLGDARKALFFYDKALSENTNNPQFYVAKARYLITQLLLDEAFSCYDIGIDTLGHVPALVIPYGDLLLNHGEVEKVEELITQCSDSTHSGVINLSIRLQLLTDYSSGMKSYYDLVRHKLENNSKINWLVEASSFIRNAEAEKDFIVRCNKHWKKLESES